MAKQMDKERPIPRADRSAGPEQTGTGDHDAPQHKDPDEYDPVGMAGKKAGIVEELKDEACEPTADEVSKKPNTKRE